MQLPEAQVALLETASATETKRIEQLAEETGLKPETVTQAAFELEDDGLVDVGESTEEDVTFTEEGAEYADAELPEVTLYRAALEAGADEDPAPMGQVIGASGLEGGAVDIALANYARKGYGVVDSGEITADADADPESDPEAAALATLADADGTLSIGEIDGDVADQLDSRGLIEITEHTTRTVTLTDEGVDALMEGIEVAETADRLTPELLTSGEWEDVEFSEYNVEADAPEVQGGRKHVLRAYSDRVKDVLVGMGFQEMDGPHADADFWIHDCLFMPQDHPARTHWDRFALDVPLADNLPPELVERVEAVHHDGVGEDGDGYHSPWSEEFASAVALRGHTTSLSMRYLSGFAGEDVTPPKRYFSVGKAYRNDTLDATHLLEFFQIEGWVLAEELSVRDLMGTFEEFYRQFGITDIEFKPHYNPYTEPSFELFGEHPETGELIEIGNSGIFREEVLEPLGVEGDVMAWGLALERLAMLATGAEDIRDLHGTLADLEFLRDAEVPY
jgi:phenylalanyl-tRNA synthetase alpha chain